MTTSDSSRLTPEDRQLLRSVLKWARANGWRGSRFVVGRRWDDAMGDNEVVWWHDTVDRDAWTLVTNLVPGEVCPRSVAQAVDVLVALGVLPAEFSSAYTAGRESLNTGTEWAMYSNGSGYVDHPTHRRESVEAAISRLWPGFDLVTREVTPWVRVSDGSQVNERRAGDA